jgi:O-antigen ligase
LYEIHVYQATGFVELHSFGQRIAFIRASLEVFSEKPLTGTGTGDVYQTLLNKVLGKGITVDPNWKGKPHNQFAFYLIAFGIPGLLLILFCWIYPVFRNPVNILFLSFALIILISMMVMDTHESYSTMAFYSLFYSMLIFGKESSEVI